MIWDLIAVGISMVNAIAGIFLARGFALQGKVMAHVLDVLELHSRLIRECQNQDEIATKDS
jgi:hypothetical protein